MKSTILLFIVFSVAFLSCKDDQKPASPAGGRDSDKNITITDTMDGNSDSIAGNYENDNDSGKPTKPNTLTGVFIRSNSKSGSCECNCVNVDFEQPTELCLDKKSGLSIMAGFRRMPDGSLSIYYQQPQNKGGVVNKKIPWDKFDKNTPIATISYNGKNAFDLDWIGFTIEGEIAVDYAIYGKKNLEGNYRKM